MAKFLLLLGLFLALLALLPSTNAVDITDILTVHPGTRNGGCDDRAAVLDQWLSESIESVHVALEAIDQYDQDPRVRKSMSQFFGIKASANSGRQAESTSESRKKVTSCIEDIEQFLNQRAANSIPEHARDRNWLFCDSTFLSLREPSSPVLDYLGRDILDRNNQPIYIANIPEYQQSLAEDARNRPWWSGDLTDLKGYFFTEDGANYCQKDGQLGLTVSIKPLNKGANGRAEFVNEKAAVILCPSSFDGNQHANSYQDANNLLSQGNNLADALPKSATLVHELFHALLGDEFLADDEVYDIADCMRLANSKPSSAQSNPENYVFFIAHMYHMFGKKDKQEPWSIHMNWDFKMMGRGKNRVFGAVDGVASQP